MTSRWLVNGDCCDSIRVDDRGFQYGDGLFETIAVRSGAPRFLGRHLARLTAGCHRLRIPAPDSAIIAAEIADLVGRDQYGTVKVIVTRGRGPRGYRLPQVGLPSRVIGFTAEAPHESRSGQGGVAIITCRTQSSSNPLLAGLKTLNRLDNVMARAEWDDDAVSEGLISDQQGCIISGTMSNVFLVRQGQLLTPALTRGGVRGIMRSLVLDLARQGGIPVTEIDVLASELAAAEEIFLTNALIGLWPVTTCNARHYGIGPMTVRIRELLAKEGVEECAQ